MKVSLSSPGFSPWSKLVIRSIGRGKITVEFFSADIEFRVCNGQWFNLIRYIYTAWDRPTCKYRSWSADEDLAITSEASLKALLAFCSPSAAITWVKFIFTVMSCWIFSQNCLRWKNVLFGCSCKEYKLWKTNIWFCYIVSRSTRTMLGSGSGSCTRKSQSGGTQMFSLVWDQLNGNGANEWQDWWLAGARRNGQEDPVQMK